MAPSRQIEYVRPAGGSGDPYKISDFAGYDHNEVAPMVNNGQTVDLEINTHPTTSDTITLNVEYNMLGKDLNTFLGGHNRAMIRVYNGAEQYIGYFITTLGSGTTTCNYNLTYNGDTDFIIKCCITDSGDQSWVYMPGDYQFNVSIYQYTQEFEISYNPFDISWSGNGYTGTPSNYNLIRSNQNLTISGTDVTFNTDASMEEQGSNTAAYITSGVYEAVHKDGGIREIKPFWPGNNAPASTGFPDPGGFFISASGTGGFNGTYITTSELDEEESLRIKIGSINIPT